MLSGLKTKTHDDEKKQLEEIICHQIIMNDSSQLTGWVDTTSLIEVITIVFS